MRCKGDGDGDGLLVFFVCGCEIMADMMNLDHWYAGADAGCFEERAMTSGSQMKRMVSAM